MASTYEFLQRLETDPIKAVYRDLDATWNARATKPQCVFA